jgi:UDP-xylose/UDP-N-acetylglucosamine transporter B4
MLAGRIIKGRRYPMLKVVAVVLLFCGVVLAAVSDAWAKQGHVRTAVVEPDSTEVTAEGGRALAAWSSQAPGFALLASALILSACMGLFSDDMYATHGRSGTVTAETLFYSHTMSLPYFLSQVRPMFFEFTSLLAVPAHDIGSITSKSPLLTPTSLLDTLTLYIPRPLLLLALNAATQLLCIIGVNRLGAQSSSLTVSIVLNIRKLVSLVLSIWLFGNALPIGVLVGAGTVFLGGGLYALPVRDGKRQEREGNEKKKKER